MKPYDIAIVGGGFSGLLTLVHLVARAPAGARYAVFEPRAQLGQGLAYGTTQPVHLLNVPAGGMSAFPDDPDHLVRWLGGAWKSGDYIPRMLYARYLSDIAEGMFRQAGEKGVTVDHIRASASDIDGGVKSADEFYPARRVLLALGNLPARRSEKDADADVFSFDYSALGTGPVAIIGTGLTMVDTLLSLRAAGYAGKVVAVSRRGLLPRVHDDSSFDYTSQAATLAAQPQKLLSLMRAFRAEAASCVSAMGSWQPAFKPWRPHLPALWQGLPLRDKKRFLDKLFTLWGIHRHRMAGSIGAQVAAELEAGTLEIRQGSAKSVAHGFEKVFDCRGPGYDMTRVDNPLMEKLLARGVVRPHATGWGIEPVAPPLYAVGTLLIGQRLETTAVPELRGQAQRVAEELLSA